MLTLLTQGRRGISECNAVKPRLKTADLVWPLERSSKSLSDSIVSDLTAPAGISENPSPDLQSVLTVGVFNRLPV